MRKYEKDSDGHVVRLNWLDRIEKHPLFDEFWEKHNRLIWWCAKRSARAYGGEAEDYIGFLTLRMNKAVSTYTGEQGEFTTYFCTHLFGDVMRHVMRHESEAWALLVARRLTKYPERLAEEVSYDSDKHSLFYHIPEHDTLFDELTKCFDSSTTSLWQYLCKGLDERSANMIYFRYKHDYTLEMLGRDYGLTKERIRQLLDRSLEKIKKRIGTLEDWVKLFKVRDEDMGDHYFSEPNFGSGRFWEEDGTPRKKKRKRRTRLQMQLARSKKEKQPVHPVMQIPKIEMPVPAYGTLSLFQVRELTKIPGHCLKSVWQSGVLIVTRDGESVMCRHMPLEDAKELCERLSLEMVG